MGWRPIQKVQKQVEPSEVEARLWKDMESQGMNHDSHPHSEVVTLHSGSWAISLVQLSGGGGVNCLGSYTMPCMI